MPRIIYINQFLKLQIKCLNADVESLQRITEEYVRNIETLICHKDEERDQLRDENVKLREKDDKLSEESSDLPTDQSSETLGAVDSEEIAKISRKRSGSF